jgi:hypothetical protein
LAQRGWTQLLDLNNQPFPLAVQFDGQTLWVAWFTNSSPAASPGAGPTIDQQIDLLNQGAQDTMRRMNEINSWSR